ncbi:MAG: histidine triad nucleotide-binding protein [Pseudomonadales bacterium]|nr:histidine triad nucleotide-binding protein [Pseudomonadales bacterium]NRA16291.1 histidine triad nucleotide-binding protein [Oceanospirillaceae bacterium]
MDCLFCKIINREIPAKIIYEDDEMIAFDDIHPKAPKHFLVIPKKHISTLNDLTDTDIPLVGKLVKTASHLAASAGIADSGYRTVFNCNKEGGQVIYHIHLHVMGGKQL